MTSKGKAEKTTKLNRQANTILLDTFELTDSASRNILISNVKQMFEKGTIRTMAEARTLIKLIQENKMKEFDEKMAKLDIAANAKAAKRRAEEVAQESNFTIQQRETTNHIIKIKNKSSELPTFELKFKKVHTTFEAAWKDGVVRLVKIASDKIKEKQNLKVVVGVECTIVKPREDEETEKTIHAHTMPESVYSEDAVDKFIRSKKGDLAKRMQARIDHQMGSGWSLKRIVGLFITTYTQKPSRGSSYIPTPTPLCNSKLGLINIKNEDQECFKYCMLYHQSGKAKNGDRITVLKKVEDKYNWEGVNFPTSFDDITTFETNNKICVNIFGYSKEQNEINPKRLGHIPYIKNDNINLLLIKDEHGNGHYLYIKKLESLLHTTTAANYKNRSYCPICRKVIGVDEIFEEHMMQKHYNCHNNCNIELPPEGATMKFKSFKNMIERPFIVYCDFECSLIPTDMSDKIAKHEPNSAAAYFVCTFDNSRNQYYKFEGRDCVQNMLEQLRLLATRCVKEQQENTKMQLTAEDTNNHKTAATCYICEGAFTESNYKVRDHCHRTGCYRGAAHNACNINYFSNRYLPVVFHNLRGYDSHLIIKKAFEIVKENEKIDAIPNSGEKFMTFSIGNLKFIDSFQFMAFSLEKLTDSLKMKTGDPYAKFTNMKRFFNEEEMKLIARKGFYPYEFIDEHAKLTYKGLPPKEAFYSKVKLDGISDEDYKHAQNVYNSFKCKDFGDYHWIYLKTDVLLLADIFENFRKMSLIYYKLDPANYLTAASLAWDAALLKTKIELELITNQEILTMIEKSKRGGLTFVGAKRYAKANNKHMGENYDSKQESSYITYVDANNLYGWAMVQPLPYKDLKFEEVSLATLETILETPNDAETGYFVEVDLEFPSEIHALFKQMPPCPETLKPDVEWFSDYQREVMEKTQANTTCEKLIPHLFKHENYVLHYRNLKFVHNLGVKITLKKVISFKQSTWLASYINGNNQLRTEAKANGDEFLVSFFKLMNNSVFGKTMEDVRNRENMHLTIDRDNAIKWFSKIEFKHANFIDGLYLIQTHKTATVYDKPVYVGCSILDISKERMLDFHYNTIHKHFNGNYDLLYSDTDSLVYQIKHNNLNKWLFEHEDEFDLSEMTGKFKSDKNKNVLGKFKSEVGSKIITEFVALSPKSYSYKYCDKEIKKAKGVSLSVSDKTMELADYKRVLDSNQSQTRTIYGIRSFNQQLYTTCSDKVVLTSFYDKMKMIDSINCEPFGFKIVLP